MSLRPAFVISRPLVPFAECSKRRCVRFRQRLAAALRSGSVPAVSPPSLHFFRPPTADRSASQSTIVEQSLPGNSCSNPCSGMPSAFAAIKRRAIIWHWRKNKEVLWSANKNLGKCFAVEVHQHGIDSGALAFVQLYVWPVLVKVVRNEQRRCAPVVLFAAPPLTSTGQTGTWLLRIARRGFLAGKCFRFW
jgi:hypothetical protein